MKKLREKIIPIVSIIWCSIVIIDQLVGDQFGLSSIYEDWATMTIITSGLFIILFGIRLVPDSQTRNRLTGLLLVLSVATFIAGLIYEDRTYISSQATSALFILLCIHGLFYERDEKPLARFALKFIVYLVSNIALIVYFIDPMELYAFPGFETVSWNTAVGFLLYSSTLLTGYHDILMERKDLPEDFSLISNRFVEIWFTISFYFPVFIIGLISVLYFLGLLSTKTGMALGLLFVCLIPFPLTYFIYTQTMKWSSEMYQKNRKLIQREQDLRFHNELLRDFAQITSHNLRGPIVGLNNMTELVESENISEERREHGYQLINQNLSKLTSTVDNLADFHNLIREGEVQYSTCNIESYVRSAVSVCQAEFGLADEAISISFNLVSPTIEYPENYFKNLIQNLITNSFKYRNEDRQLILSVSSKEIDHGGAELKIRDNGLGMNLEYFGNKIFKFGSTYHEEESQGIGLFIVKNQLARLGDSISVRSNEDEFTEFIIQLNRNGKKELGYR